MFNVFGRFSSPIEVQVTIVYEWRFTGTNLIYFDEHDKIVWENITLLSFLLNIALKFFTF